MDIQLKKLENRMLMGYLVSKALKTKFQLLCLCLRDNFFNDNNIHIARCCRHIGNKMADKKRKKF